MGLGVYAECILERLDVQVGFSQQALELGVLGFKFTQPLRIRGLHASVLGSSLVEGGIAEAAMLPAQLLELHVGLGLPAQTNDLLLGESALFHVHHSPG